MFVIGTAGHIDHGKSALVKALTGIDPDRLPEEKLRGLTIDLGFAWFGLPSGEQVGIVDVPGHEKFIKNMVAGVGAIDAVMLVIAADDGWMPQTAEHLDILTLLDVRTGIVVLSKVDLVDEEYIELQKQDIAQRLKGTFLENAPIIPFSVKNDGGKHQILTALDEVLGRGVSRLHLDSPRLYIDRSFIIKGIGTVVTGTLKEGEIRVAQELELCPPGTKVRVRGLQTHKQSRVVAVPGSRVAVNLAGIGKDAAQRGSALVVPGHFSPTTTLGVKIKMLPAVKNPVRDNSEILVLLGTAAAHAKIRLFGKKQVGARVEDLAILHLDREICCRIGDKFIIRRLSPPITVGGGTVLDWEFGPARKNRTKQLEILRARENLSLESVVESELLKSKSLDLARIKVNSCFRPAEVDEYLAKNKDIVKAGGSLVKKEHLEKFVEPALLALREQHAQKPWAIGLASGDLAKRLKLPMAEIEELVAYLVSSGAIAQESGLLRLKDHEPHLKPQQCELAAKLNAMLSASPLASPLKKEFIAEDPGFEVVIDLLRGKGEIIELKNGVLFTRKDFREIIEKVTAFIKSEGRVTASGIKDELRTTRKYIIPLLEELDAMGVTRRDGDYRMLEENV